MSNISAHTSCVDLLVIGSIALSLVSCIPRTSPPEQLDYRDSVEGAAGMYIEDLASTNAKLYELGETSLAGVPQ